MIATPINTIGMGDIEPYNTDPIPTKKLKTKKRKMKGLKEYIKKRQRIESIEESMDKGDWESRVWETNEVCDFFNILAISDKDIDLFNDSHKEEITEYAAETALTDDFILGKISTMKEVEDFEPTLLYKMLQITKGEANCYWYDNGSGLKTICIEVQNLNREHTNMYIFGADKYEFDKILDEIKNITTESFKKTDCLVDLFDFSDDN